MKFCSLKMGQGELALMDAQHCRMQCSGWAKACYLEEAAQMLLKAYEEPCDAFLVFLMLLNWIQQMLGSRKHYGMPSTAWRHLTSSSQNCLLPRGHTCPGVS
ncbi:hypothetical protein PAHAL_1G234700 [Panicum hallii]|uniref:Uncharacterized protein n=1 Tax=Panicum hallii TaxID=206008 RepID=A0A2S3GP08_9POAL|nr:hypothetical protein PAHAL_1G234700 [Panicum hallii]PVH66403.1 hypothetical protein PAHAL_1G234700 [Panicum hallii]